VSEPQAPVQFRGVSKEYRIGFWMSRKVRALQSLDLTIPEGEVFGLLGPNGAGKSTTIKILMNLVQASEGTATLFSQAPSHRMARARVGFVPENPAPYEYLTGREFVSLAASLAGMPAAEARPRVEEVLAAVQMDRAADLRIRRYSKGIIQRIALAQALVHRPDLLVLDEPTSGLDPLGRKLVRDQILAERRRGATVLFCTHIIADVEAVCDRVGVLVGGRLVREGLVSELLTTQVPLVEVVLEGIQIPALEGLGVSFRSSESLAGRTLVRISDADLPRLLSATVAGGGRVRSVQPERYTLEDLFLSTLAEAGGKGTVGSEIVS